MDYQFLQFNIQENENNRIICRYNTSELLYGYMYIARNLTKTFTCLCNKSRSKYGYPNIYYNRKDALIIDVGLFINCKVNIINPTGDYLTATIYDRNNNILRKIEKSFKCVIIIL